MLTNSCNLNENETLLKLPIQNFEGKTEFTVLRIILFGLISLCSSKSLVAKAYHMKTEKLIYQIQIQTDELNYSKFKYVAPNGQTIATKDFNYSQNCPYSPEIQFKSLKTLERTELRIKNSQVHIEKSNSNDPSHYSQPRACTLLWDEGIHRYILSQWRQLRNRPQEVRIYAYEDDQVLDFVLTMDSNFKITLKPKNPLYRMLVPEIYFQYSQNTKLLEYRGVSDIKDSQGKRPEVLIKYIYPSL